MRNFAAIAALSIVVAACVRAQSSEPKFDAASVKTAAAVSEGGGRGAMEGGPGTPSPRRISYRGVTLKQVVAAAWGVRPFQIAGPDWIDGTGAPTFDITAAIPAGTDKEAFEQMLQRLLSRSFKLEVHDAPRDFPVYELRAAGAAPKLMPSAQRAGTVITASRKGGVEVKSTGGTMEMFASALELQLKGTAVVDQTKLTGNYDFALVFAGPEAEKKAPLPPLESAIESQLGLTLAKGTATLDVLVIDHAEQRPAGR